MVDPKPEEIINVEGPQEHTIFRRLILWCLPENASEEFQAKIDDEIFGRVQELDDDRLLVLVGALVVENTIDELLASIMPGYKSLQGNKDFSFSMRIETAKALRLIPSWILNNADFIRNLRNDFVHDLSVEKLNKLDASKIQSMRDRLKRINPQEFDDEVQVFRMLATWTAIAIYSYTSHVSLLNEFIRSDNLGENLKKFADLKNSAA